MHDRSSNKWLRSGRGHWRHLRRLDMSPYGWISPVFVSPRQLSSPFSNDCWFVVDGSWWRNESAKKIWVRGTYFVILLNLDNFFQRKDVWIEYSFLNTNLSKNMKQMKVPLSNNWWIYSRASGRKGFLCLFENTSAASVTFHPTSEDSIYTSIYIRSVV